MPRLEDASKILLIMAAIGLSPRPAPAADLMPTTSVVDYLKSKDKPSSMAARKQMYEAKFGGHYTGSGAQNERLLDYLLLGDGGASEALASAQAALRSAAPAGSTTAQAHGSFRRWIPAEGFGVHGSYAVSVHVRLNEGRLVPRAFQVSVASGAAHLGRLDFTGSVELRVDGAAVKTMSLQPAWFATLGSGSSSAVFKYLARDSEGPLPAGGSVVARVTVSPTVATGSGHVSLYSGTVDVKLR